MGYVLGLAAAGVFLWLAVIFIEAVDDFRKRRGGKS